MILFCSFLVIFLLSDVSGGIIESLERSVRSVRVERATPVCDENAGKQEFQACWENAEEEFKAAIDGGDGFVADDGRPDLVERKTCNLITSLVQECGKYLVHCYTEESVEAHLDTAIEAYVDLLEKDFDAWDSQKCPVVKDFIARSGSEMKTSFMFNSVTISLFVALRLMA